MIDRIRLREDSVFAKWLMVNGGEISNNQVRFWWCRDQPFGDTEATMNVGKIAGNSAPSSGGINAMDTNVFGGAKRWLN